MGNVPAFRHTTTSNCYKDGIIVYCLAINKKYISKSTYTVNDDSRYTPNRDDTLTTTKMSTFCQLIHN